MLTYSNLHMDPMVPIHAFMMGVLEDLSYEKALHPHLLVLP